MMVALEIFTLIVLVAVGLAAPLPTGLDTDCFFCKGKNIEYGQERSDNNLGIIWPGDPTPATVEELDLDAIWPRDGSNFEKIWPEDPVLPKSVGRPIEPPGFDKIWPEDAVVPKTLRKPIEPPGFDKIWPEDA